jgi:hypothetical protein
MSGWLLLLNIRSPMMVLQDVAACWENRSSIAQLSPDGLVESI